RATRRIRQPQRHLPAAAGCRQDPVRRDARSQLQAVRREEKGIPTNFPSLASHRSFVSTPERTMEVETGLSTSWSRSRIGAFLSQPVSWVFIFVGGIIGFLSLYPTFFLFYGSLTHAPLGVPAHFTLQNYRRP